MKSFSLEVITPEKTVYSGAVTSLTVPAEGGSMGVLAGHAPLLTSVEIGDAKILDETGTEVHFFVSTGFLEVANDEARLLVEVSERDEDIDEERARVAEKRARERIERRFESDLDLARAEAALRRALMRGRIRRKRKSSGS